MWILCSSSQWPCELAVSMLCLAASISSSPFPWRKMISTGACVCVWGGGEGGGGGGGGGGGEEWLIEYQFVLHYNSSVSCVVSSPQFIVSVM